MAVNYQLELEKTLKKIAGDRQSGASDEHDTKADGARPRLLLHACCAPCSSYVLEYLSEYFDISIDFYNPNIAPKEEFAKREAELARLIKDAPFGKGVTLLPAEYDADEFYSAVKGLEDIPEGGARCKACYRLRLEHTAALAGQLAKAGKCDYFCTTLSISPHKNAAWLNEIGAELAEKYGVKYLHSDFKKRGGFKRSGELSEIYGLYRQDYCGCIFSQKEAKEREAKRAQGSGSAQDIK